MSWKCQVCGRLFKTKNQWHSCYTVSIEVHLLNKPESIVRAFGSIMEFCMELGEFEINPVKSSVQLRAGATFLGIRVKKSRIELEFFSEEILTHPAIIKSLRVSSNRAFNVIVLKESEKPDDDLLKFIKKSYWLVSSSGKGI